MIVGRGSQVIVDRGSQERRLAIYSGPHIFAVCFQYPCIAVFLTFFEKALSDAWQAD